MRLWFAISEILVGVEPHLKQYYSQVFDSDLEYYPSYEIAGKYDDNPCNSGNGEMLADV